MLEAAPLRPALFSGSPRWVNQGLKRAHLLRVRGICTPLALPDVRAALDASFARVGR